jgi:amidase
MPIRTPSLTELARAAAYFGLDTGPENLTFLQASLGGFVESYRRLEEMIESPVETRYPRTAGYRPAPAENPLGAWYRRTEVVGAGEGPLAGRTVALKDNICLAGVPMMNGTRVLEGYTPEEDATIVTRILDAGGTITGKAVCEALCFSGASHTSDTGPVHNPWRLDHSAGGSSSGCAALVASGAVDMAVGGDQGGSIRGPSAWCGIYGLKPTYGLVPCTGVFPIEMTLDHAGPMAKTIEDIALLLESISGPDGLDPRQAGAPLPTSYLQALTGDVAGLRIGLVPEGFRWSESQPDVDDAVETGARAFEPLGASVRTLSIPLHRDAIHIWTAIIVEGATQLMIEGNGQGSNWKGRYTISMQDAFARGRLAAPDLLPDTVKPIIVMAHYMKERYHGHFYARARNLALELTRAYDAALCECDLLAMPTMPMKATPLPPANASREEWLARAWQLDPNQAPFDVTGHPAINVPVGFSEGLPVGMMLIGRIGEDATVLRAAHAFQRGVFAPPMPSGVTDSGSTQYGI